MDHRSVTTAAGGCTKAPGSWLCASGWLEVAIEQTIERQVKIVTNADLITHGSRGL